MIHQHNISMTILGICKKFKENYFILSSNLAEKMQLGLDINGKKYIAVADPFFFSRQERGCPP